MIIALILVVLLLISVPLLAVRRARRPPPAGCSTEWQPNIRLICTSVPLICGGISRSLYLMRRPGPDGNWQYRKMTSDERADYIDVFRY
jgi:hypothetical protein